MVLIPLVGVSGIDSTDRRIAAKKLNFQDTSSRKCTDNVSI